MKHDWISFVSVAILVVIWGSAFGLTSVALEGFNPIEVSFGRTLFAAFVVSVISIAAGQGLPKTFLEWRWVSLMGIVGLAVPVTALSWAQQSVESSVASIFIAAVPLFILLMARVILKEHISRRKWIGFAIGFSGLAWLAGPSALGELGKSGQGLAQMVLIFTALGYASGGIIIKLMPEIPPFRATAGSMIAGSVFLAPFGGSALPNAVNVPIVPVLALLSRGILSSGAGQLIRYFTVKRKGPVFMSVVGYMLPVWAGFVGFFILDEVLTWHTVSAYAVILGGLLISRDRVKK